MTTRLMQPNQPEGTPALSTPGERGEPDRLSTVREKLRVEDERDDIVRHRKGRYE